MRECSQCSGFDSSPNVRVTGGFRQYNDANGKMEPGRPLRNRLFAVEYEMFGLQNA